MAATNDPNAPPETLLGCLRRRLAPAVSLGALLAIVGATAVWISLPGPRHTVRTRLRVPPAHNRPVDLGKHQRNEVALAKSAAVLVLRDPATAKLSVVADQGDPVAWLEQNVRVDFSIAPEIMQISMSGTKTDELKMLVTAVREAYLTEVRERDRPRRVQRGPANAIAQQIELEVPNRIALLEDVTVMRADTNAVPSLLAGALGAFCLGLFGVAGLEYRRAARLQTFKESKP